jgi:ubiquinone/menaquinone biosynthesis C-methylase UbiE
MKLVIGEKNTSVREKWLKKTIKKIPKNSKILDAGAGELQYKKYCKHLNYTSQDFANYDGVGDSTGLQTEKWNNDKIDIVSDIASIPVKNSSFDAVMCVEVLEHIPYPEKAIREFSRILKKNGKLVLTAPFASLTHFAPYFYSSGYSEYWYRKVLEDHGFRIIELEKNGNYFEYIAQEVRRLPYIESQYVDIKKPLSSSRIGGWLRGLALKTLTHLEKNSKRSEELLYLGVQVYACKK